MELFLGVLVVTLGLFGQVVDPLLEAVEIGQHQLGFDGLDIGQRRDLALDMGNVGILEAAHHVSDRIDLANGGKKLVAEALTLGGATHQSRDIDESQPGRNDLRRLADLVELVEPGIGHRDLTHVRLDRAERLVCRLRCRRFRQRVEQRRLAHIRQSDDTAFESHDVLNNFFCHGRARPAQGRA